MSRPRKKPSEERAISEVDEAGSPRRSPSSDRVQPGFSGSEKAKRLRACDSRSAARLGRSGNVGPDSLHEDPANKERARDGRGAGEERAKRMHKDPFKKLRGLADPTDHAELYRTFTAPGADSPKAGFFQGLPIDLTGRFESKTFVCRSLDGCVSTMQCCGSLVFVALKEDAEPFNVFQFASGRSVLAVFDRSLNQVDTVFFELGTVIQMEVSGRSNAYHCTALFHSGALASFEYSPRHANAAGDTQPLQAEERVLARNKHVRDFKFIENAAGVIRFHSRNGVFVYTDGFTITRIDSSGKTVSKRFKALIIDLAVMENDGAEFIYILDRNGRHFFCRSDFTGFGELGVFVGFSRLLVLEEHGLLISTDEFTCKKFFIAPFTDKQHRKACRYYLRTWDGAVTVHRLLNRQNVSRRLLQIVPRSEGILFCTSKAEFDLFRDSRCHIAALSVFEDCFFLATEAGLLAKVLFD